MITLLLLVRATYIWVLFFAHIPFVVNRTFNANGEVATASWPQLKITAIATWQAQGPHDHGAG